MSIQPGSYNPNVPANRPDDLATSQPQLLNNFLQIYNIFANNHIALDSASNAGNHTIIQLFEQSNAIQTNTGEINVYTKDVEGQTDQIFLKYQGPSGQEFQFTTYQIYSLIPTDTQISYFTFLPGNILIYFGTINSPAKQNTLDLKPSVGKNLITANFTPIMTVPSIPLLGDAYKPSISIKKENEIITSLVLNQRKTLPQPKKLNYFVMVNL